MRVLILGGTVFLGRHLIDAALRRGHEVTIFNRGRREAEIPAGVERLKGDRDGGLEALGGRRWDVVFVDHVNLEKNKYLERKSVQEAAKAQNKDGLDFFLDLSLEDVAKDTDSALASSRGRSVFA